MRRSRSSLVGCALCALAPCALAACTGTLNQADGPLCYDLAALRGTPPAAARPVRADAPSLARGEHAPWSARSGWTTIAVRVPSAEVETQPAYRTEVSSRHASSPAQIATAPTHAAIDLLLLGPRMIGTPPGSTVRAPKSADGPAPDAAREESR